MTMPQEVENRYNELQDIFAALDDELAGVAEVFDDLNGEYTAENLMMLLKEWAEARKNVYVFVQDYVRSVNEAEDTGDEPAVD